MASCYTSARSAAVGATRLTMLPHHVHRREPSVIAHVELRAEVDEDDARGRQACRLKAAAALKTAEALKAAVAWRECCGRACRHGLPARDCLGGNGRAAVPPLGGAVLFRPAAVPMPAQKWSGVRPFGSQMFGLAPICSAVIIRVQLAACVALSSSSSASERAGPFGSAGMGFCSTTFLFTLTVTFVSSSSTTAAATGAASAFGFTVTLNFVPLLSLLLAEGAAALPLGAFTVIFTLLSLSPSASSGCPVRRQLR